MAESLVEMSCSWPHMRSFGHHIANRRTCNKDEYMRVSFLSIWPVMWHFCGPVGSLAACYSVLFISYGNPESPGDDV